MRLTGINEIEQSVYSRDPSKRRGECHALEATARFEQLIARGGDVVRLAAQNPNSTSRQRLRRAVAVRIDGVWRDTGQILVDEGHVLWVPSGTE